MRKITAAICAGVLLLLCACGAGSIHVELKKAQEIDVFDAGGELIKTLSSDSELDSFYDMLDAEDWGETLKLPENAVKRGELVVRQTETLKLGQSPDELQMEELGRLCVYEAPYITFELAGVRICFAASDAAQAYFDSLFE